MRATPSSLSGYPTHTWAPGTCTEVWLWPWLILFFSLRRRWRTTDHLKLTFVCSIEQYVNILCELKLQKTILASLQAQFSPSKLIIWTLSPVCGLGVGCFKKLSDYVLGNGIVAKSIRNSRWDQRRQTSICIWFWLALDLFWGIEILKHFKIMLWYKK